MEYNTQETRSMAERITDPSLAEVQTALNQFWAKHGKPSEQLVEMLRREVRDSVRVTLTSFFGKAAEELPKP